MANTYVDYTATAGQTDFAFSFPYLEDSHVVVEVEGVNQALTTNYTIETSPAQKVVLSSPTTAIAGGELVRVKRVSAPDENLVDFVNGSVLTETELDRAYLHNRYLSEEAYDGVNAGLGELEGSTNYNANNKQIKNLADGTLATDAVNKGYVDTQIALTDTNLAGFYKSTHTGNAVDNVFTLSFTPQTTDAKAYIVSIDGLVQVPDTDYTIGATAITFNTIPANSAEICVVATAASSVATVNEAQVTATGSSQARSLADRFADVINVADFSGWGGTASQNRQALSAALSYVETGAGQNKTVYIPEGEYEIDQGISIVSSSIIKGAGSGSTILKVINDFGAGNNLFLIPGRQNIRIQDIQFDGNRAGQSDFKPPSQPSSDNGNICLYIVGSSNVTVDNCYFKDWTKDAITLLTTSSYPTRPSKINVNNCKFDTIRRNGISVIEGDSLNFNNNYFFGGSDLDKTTEVVLNNGIRIEPDLAGESIIDCIVSNNQFKDLHGGCNVYAGAAGLGASTNVFRNIVISDNVFSNIVSEAGVVIYQTDLSTASATDEDGYIITGNKFYQCGPDSANDSVAYGGGISANRCNNLTISNNFFNGCDGNNATIGLNQAGLNTNISNNTFQLDEKRAIIVNSPPTTTRTQLNIINNICSRGGQKTANTYPAIQALGNASNSGSYFISNNIIQTSTSNSYSEGIRTGYDDGTSVIGKNLIQGNGIDYVHAGGTRFNNLFEQYSETVTTSGALAASLTYEISRSDNIVNIHLGSLTGTTSAASSIIIGTIPEQFRPSVVLYGRCSVVVNNVTDSESGIIEVRDNGLVLVSRAAATFTTDPNSGFTGVTFTYSL